MASYSSTHQLVYVKQLNLNAVADTPIFVPFARFQVTGMKLSNASRTLAASGATVGLYTAPAAAGTAIVTPAVATALTTADIVDVRTLASTALASGTVVNNTLRQLYVRVGVADGAAATCDVLIELTRWAGP